MWRCSVAPAVSTVPSAPIGEKSFAVKKAAPANGYHYIYCTHQTSKGIGPLHVVVAGAQVSAGRGKVSLPRWAQGICNRSSIIWRYRHVQGGHGVAGVVFQDRKAVHGLQQASQQAAVRSAFQLRVQIVDFCIASSKFPISRR